MAEDFDALAAAYERERPIYEKLANAAKTDLESALAGRGLHALVTARAKETTTFVIKALVGERYVDPLAQITDKAGVRIIVPYARDVDDARGAVYKLFHIVNEESKLAALSYNENGYLGLHLDAHYRAGSEPDPDLVGRRFEVQIRTIAQWAWAEVSHEQLYKPPTELPTELKRAIYRLVSLVELFDGEVGRFLEAARKEPGFSEAQVLVPLQRVLLERFNVRHRPDRRLSMLIAAALVPLYDLAPEAVYPNVLAEWIDCQNEALIVQFAEAREMPGNPLLTQPEVFLVFERLDNDRLRLDQRWPSEVPRKWLLELAAMWSVQLP